MRINGAQLRAKVVGEGGNLGLSQLGRIEYALQGGRLNTDFIDNSAGVNTSDVEVESQDPAHTRWYSPGGSRSRTGTGC